MTGETDSVVLALPEAAWPGLGGELLGALVAAGAFAAFMSTASGLLVSVAGTLSFDLRRGAGRGRAAAAALPGWRRSAAWSCRSRSRWARASSTSAVLVGWAFALAASTFCPLLLLGIWWARLTARGAAAGLVAGAGTATAAIFTGLAVEDASPTVDALLTQPAVISVPVAFATMVLVSLRDRAGQRGAAAELLAMHAPEGLGLREA